LVVVFVNVVNARGYRCVVARIDTTANRFVVVVATHVVITI